MAKKAGEKKAGLLIEHIMESIKSGALLPGDKLPSEHELMQLTGISRGSVREALSAMELVGVIRRQQGGGTYVKNTVPSLFGVDSEELFYEFMKDAENSNHSFAAFEARALFEPKVAALAAQRAGTENIEELSGIVERMADAAEKKNCPKMVKLDLEFHIAVAKATHNEIIAKTMKRIMEMADAQMFRTYKRTNPKEIHDEHRRIFEAIRDGAQEAARVCCEYNIMKNYKPL